MAKAARKVKLSKRQIEAYRERDARAAAAWAVFSGGPSQAGLPFDDPHKQFMDRVRYDAIYSAYMADPPVASKDDGPEIRRIKSMLPECGYPDGIVPEHVRTSTVRDQVNRLIKARNKLNKRNKKALEKLVSYESVRRARGRRAD